MITVNDVAGTPVHRRRNCPPLVVRARMARFSGSQPQDKNGHIMPVPNQIRQQVPPKQEPFTRPDLAGTLAAWQPMFNAFNTWHGQFGATMAKASYAWMDFVSRRLTQDVALGQRLAACQRSEEAFRIYADFYRKAMEDYQSEIMTMTQLGADLAHRSAQQAIRRPQDDPRKPRPACP